jgi:hypothetical protein
METKGWDVFRNLPPEQVTFFRPLLSNDLEIRTPIDPLS